MTITESQKSYLIHMLGMGSNVRRCNKGYRNYYCAGVGLSEERDLLAMAELGLVIRGRESNDGASVCFHATEKGMNAIGMTKAQKKRAMKR